MFAQRFFVLVLFFAPKYSTEGIRCPVCGLLPRASFTRRTGNQSTSRAFQSAVSIESGNRARLCLRSCGWVEDVRLSVFVWEKVSLCVCLCIDWPKGKVVYCYVSWKWIHFCTFCCLWGSSEESLPDHLSVWHCCLRHWKKCHLKRLRVVASKLIHFIQVKIIFNITKSAYVH